MTLKIDRWGLLEARREIQEHFPNHDSLESFPVPVGSFRFRMVWDSENWVPIERLPSEIEYEEKPRKSFRNRSERRRTHGHRARETGSGE
jgi:hypothetical protein